MVDEAASPGPPPVGAETLAGWIADDSTIPREQWDAARAHGWRGPGKGWRVPFGPREAPTEAEAEAQDVIETTLAERGIDVRDQTWPAASSTSGEPVICFRIDQYGDALGTMPPPWLRRGALATVKVREIEGAGTPQFTASISVWNIFDTGLKDHGSSVQEYQGDEPLVISVQQGVQVINVADNPERYEWYLNHAAAPTPREALIDALIDMLDLWDDGGRFEVGRQPPPPRMPAGSGADDDGTTSTADSGEPPAPALPLGLTPEEIQSATIELVIHQDGTGIMPIPFLNVFVRITLADGRSFAPPVPYHLRPGDFRTGGSGEQVVIDVAGVADWLGIAAPPRDQITIDRDRGGEWVPADPTLQAEGYRVDAVVALQSTPTAADPYENIELNEATLADSTGANLPIGSDPEIHDQRRRAGFLIGLLALGALGLALIAAFGLGLFSGDGDDVATDVPSVEGDSSEVVGVDGAPTCSGVLAAPEGSSGCCPGSDFGTLPFGLCAFVVADDDDTQSFSILGTQALTNDAVDIKGTAAAVVTFESDFHEAAIENTSFPCGASTADVRVTCPVGVVATDPGDFVVVEVRYGAELGSAPGRSQYGLAFDDDGDDADNYGFTPPFDGDLFRGTEHWYRLSIAEDGTRHVWVDGVRDGTPGVPRASGAAAIEVADTLVWIIPRAELGSGPLVYRATGFFDTGPVGAVPTPETSGGDVTGADVLDPLLAITEAVRYADPSTLPPPVEGGAARSPIPDDLDAHQTAALVDDLQRRIDEAISAGGEEVYGIVLPEVLASPLGDRCREELDGSLARASEVAISDGTPQLDVSSGGPLYQATGSIVYDTGEVAYAPVLAPSGVDGRLYLLPGCVAG